MSLVDDVYRLHPHQVKEACDVMLTASIALEVGTDWRIHFIRAKNRSVGRLRRIFDVLSKTDISTARGISKALTEVNVVTTE